MHAPKLSVALVTYNHAPYVAQALESIFAQQFDHDWELVVGDDASTDSTNEIIQSFASRYPHRIRALEHAQNQGMHRNFLRTLEACSGEYVAILEGDDFWTAAHKVRSQSDFLDRHPDCPACFHPVSVVGDQSQPLNEIFPGERPQFLPLSQLLRSNDIPTGSLMFRRALLPPMPATTTTLAMADWPLFIQFARHGAIGCVNEVMGAYRRHSAGMWSSQNETTRMKNIHALHEWLLREGLSGDERATWAAMAHWDARQALHQARAGYSGPALRHLLHHLKTSLRGQVLPEWKMILKTVLATLAQRSQTKPRV